MQSDRKRLPSTQTPVPCKTHEDDEPSTPDHADLSIQDQDAVHLGQVRFDHDNNGYCELS